MAGNPWAGLGAMIDRASAFAPDPYGLALANPRRNYSTYVFPKILDGMNVDYTNMREIIGLGWGEAQLALGHKLGVWTFLQRENPGGQGKLFHDLIREIESSLDLPRGEVFAVVNDEIQAQPKVARGFLTAFRLRSPLRNAAVCPLGLGFKGGDGVWYPAECALDAYKLARFRDLVQTYDGQMQTTNVSGALAAHARSMGATWVRPVLSATDEPLRGLVSLGAAQHSGTYWKGVCVFPGERLDPADWEKLARSVAINGFLA